MSSTSARDAQRLRQESQRRRDRHTLALVAVGIVVLLVAGGIGFQAWRSSRLPSGGPAAPASATPVALEAGQPVVFGSADAPVRISLYEDFHCPHCADFEEQYASVLDTAQARGQAAVQVFPLAFVDPGSAAAANGFACAAQAGFGQTYYRGLFANPDLEWNDDQLLRLAEQSAGAPPSTAFRECVTGRASQPWLDSISTAATEAGVQSTPTVLLDGDPLDLAALTPQALAARIDEAAAR